VSDQKIWSRLTYGVPILMYHAFCEKGEPPGRYVHSIHKFKYQLRCLKLLGYQIIPLVDYLESLVDERLPPSGSVIITMDDGYSDNPKVAYPVLNHFKAPATFFLVSNYLGRVNDWDTNSELTGRQLFGLEDARKLQDDLIAFGSHTHTHPWLGTLPAEQARDEIESSKEELERQLGSCVLLFSYPHGDYNEVTPKLVEEAGYLGACTTTTGLNTPASSRFTLNRTEIRGNYSLPRFLRAVWFGK
jgi:peptidoglycan/xylan/chitin deacetylase (PgdA/CDA1 family)